METIKVSENGQIMIPRSVRDQLGIQQGSRVEFSVVGDHLELRVQENRTTEAQSGFGMLKSTKKAVPADLDPASLIEP